MREGRGLIEEEADRLIADGQPTGCQSNSSQCVQAGTRGYSLSDYATRRKGFRLQTEVHDLNSIFRLVCLRLVLTRHLRQVLDNLVSNAIKYSPDGGTIRIGGWHDEQGVTVYVADQGIGVPQDEQSRLFESFYRVDSGLRRRTKGTGLGLYLSKTIINTHNGTIWVRSKSGNGSTFFFTLPIAAITE